MFKHKLNFDRANLIFAALSLTLLKVIHALFAVVYAAVDVSDSRKGDNFRLMDRVLIGPFEITVRQSIFLGVRSGSARTMDWLQVPNFFFSPGLAPRAKCCVRLA